MVMQIVQMGYFGFYFFFCDMVSFVYVDDLVDRQSIRVYIVFVFVVMYLCFNVNMWFMMYIQCVNVFWIINFMIGEGYQIYFQLVQVDRQFVYVLGGVNVVDDIVCVVYFVDGCDILYYVDFVVYVYDGNQNGVVMYCCFEFVEIDDVVVLWCQVGYFKFFVFKLMVGVQYCFVFGFVGDDVFVFFLIKVGSVFDCQVIGFCCF